MSNRVKLAIFLLLVLAAAVPASAQTERDWNRTDDTMQSALGLHYGKIGGTGLALRLPVRWFLYLQAAGGIWHSSDRKQHNLGVELQYTLRQDSRIRLYLSGGVGYFYDDEKISESGTSEVWEKDKDWNTGFGVGVEVLQGPRWSFQIEGDFVHEGKSGDIKVFPQAGIYYYW